MAHRSRMQANSATALRPAAHGRYKLARGFVDDVVSIGDGQCLRVQLPDRVRAANPKNADAPGRRIPSNRRQGLAELSSVSRLASASQMIRSLAFAWT